MTVDLDGRSHLFDSATIGNDDLVRYLDCLVLVMGNENTGDTQLANHLFQPGSQFLPHLCINGGKRLVQQEQLRIRCKRSGKCHTLTLTAGKLTGITSFQSTQTDQINQLHNTAVNGFAVGFLDLQAKGNVVIHGHVPEQCVILEHKADATLACRDIVDHFPVDLDLAAVRMFQTSDHPQDGCLAASAGTQETDQLSLFNAKADIIGRLVIAETLLNMVQFYIHQMSLFPRCSMRLRITRITIAIMTRMDETANAGTYWNSLNKISTCSGSVLVLPRR